jgi:D-arabinitol dehydrogenase (NADP+)
VNTSPPLVLLETVVSPITSNSESFPRISVTSELMNSNFAKCYKIKNLSDEEATLLEPASCAIHGMDKLKMPFGAKVLLIGAGPTGLILAQLMKIGGAGHITIAANKGE